jgi:hypothetical protein
MGVAFKPARVVLAPQEGKFVGFPDLRRENISK